MTLNDNTGRNARIIRTSVIGIISNVLLAAFKAAVGLTVSSVAIIMDAVNNISDAASSVITIIGTKLAGKEADRKHPFGYGRIEYLSAMIIALLVLYAGITAFVESVKKIIAPDTPDYGTASLVIVAAAVFVKVILGRYVKKVGMEVNSDSLINSGDDAMLDSVISASTLAAAAAYLLFGIRVEAYLGCLIAVVIVKSGFDMLKETLSKILGERADADLARKIKTTIAAYPEVNGVYDLVLHNYGPDSYNGSVHIEVPDTLSADDLDKLLRRIQVKVYEENDVILTAIGVYSYNTKDPDAVRARECVSKIVTENPNVLQMHGFYIDKAEKTIRFDIVVSFDAGDRKAVYDNVCAGVRALYPDYTLQVAMDTDFTDA
ncbi:MAG: cation transporter [Lachnospiraceae bacterium]|nr:cation transporter [Lachnospiraceae bacterium]